MKTTITTIIIILLCAGCSPSKRLQRIISNNPELIQPEILTFADTLAIPEIQADTFFPLSALSDTIKFGKDRLEVTLHATPSAVWVKGRCKPDTIVKTRQVTVEKIKIVKPGRLDAIIAKIPWFVSGIIALVLIGIMLLIARKHIKDALP